MLQLSLWSALRPSPVCIRLLRPLLTSDVRSRFLAKSSVRPAAARLFQPDTRQTSQVKFLDLRHTLAGFTEQIFDGWRTSSLSCGLVPSAMPTIRFLFVESWLRYTLPSDPVSRRVPLRFASPSPPSSWTGDSHPQVEKHAWQTRRSVGQQNVT